MIIESHSAVGRALRHPALSSALLAASPVSAAHHSWITRQLDLSDPPSHTRVRRLFASAFDHRQVARLEHHLERWLGEHVTRLPRAFDVVSDLAAPLSRDVLLTLLGLPPGLDEQFSEHALAAVDAMNDGRDADYAVSAESVRRTFRDAAHHPGLEPSGLVALVTRNASANVDEDDLVANVLLTFAAGREPLRHLIGNAVHLVHAGGGIPDAAGRAEWLAVVDETLRLESPVQFVRRVPTRAAALEGAIVAPNQVITLHLGRANRDHATFVEPWRFNPGRTPNPHLAFGGGRHRCLGAGLARTIAAETLAALFARRLLPTSATPEWLASPVYRGLARLTVERV